MSYWEAALLPADGIPSVPSVERSTIGQVDGGTTQAAGTAVPATCGTVILNPTGANTWVKITGTASKPGDLFFVSYAGRRVAFPANPAQRIVTIAGPGEPGSALLTGEIEIAINGVNTDLTTISWWILSLGA